MTSLKDTLKGQGVFPYKGRGQHFLVNTEIAERIVDLADLTPDDVVVEIGPGTGVLTGILVRRAGRVIAVESDRKLAALVGDAVGSDRLEVVLGDALRYDYHALGASIGGRFTVVANIPYNISTPLIFRLLSAHQHVKTIVLMLQREVAVRLTAPAGTKEYGALTVTASLLADMSIGLYVGKNNFYPRPKVDSAVVVFEVLDRPRTDVSDTDTFTRVVRAAFSGRRKTLRNALKAIVGKDAPDVLEEIGELSGIDLGRRGETCSVEEFAALSRAVGSVTAGRGQEPE